MSKRMFLIGGGALVALGAAGYWFGLRPMLHPKPPEVGFALAEEELAAARAFMGRHPIIDSHSHPGRTFLKDAENLTFKIRLYKLLGGTFEDRTIADMVEGHVDGAVFNGVADIQLLTLGDGGLTAARAFMGRHPIIDSHSHPGRTFLRDAENLSFKIWLYKLLGGTFEDRTIADMVEGHVDGAVFNGVADIQLLTLGDGGLTAAREFQPGEAWASYRRQIENLRALSDKGLVRLCLTADDVLAAKKAGKRAAILAMEGADFLEGDLSRLAQVYDDGVRMLTLVHYHNSALGDIMTGPVGNRGLTDFGREAVAAIDEAGIMLDLSHASEKTAFGALEVAKGPVVLTHTHIKTADLDNPRFVSPELATAVADTGGYIGAWPAGIGQTTLAQFIDRIEFLLDTVGEDHVAMGSDMDANYKPVLETYRKFPLVVGALMKRGHSEETLAKIMGGNVLGVMRKAAARRA